MRQQSTSRGSSIPTWALAAALLLPGGAAAADATDGGAALLERQAPAIVTVQFVLAVEVAGAAGAILGENQEMEGETSCLTVSPEGLILCSTTQLGGYTAITQRMMGRMGLSAEIAATPTRLKVLLAGDSKPREARLLGRDTDLDLSWLELASPPAAPLPYFDFARGRAARLGEPFFALRRLDRYFDRAPVLLEGRIGGLVAEPRPLYVPSGGEVGLGWPVLAAGGEVLGITILQLPEAGSIPQGSGSPLESMGWSARMQDIARGLVLPAAEVVKATERARKSFQKTAK